MLENCTKQCIIPESIVLFRAHKCILNLASDRFEAIYHYGAQNAKIEAFSAELSNPVEVPDVEIGAFRVMLSFIYADDLSELGGHNAMALLYAAKKYGVDGLIDHCLQIPISNLPNVFVAYAQARLFELEDFSCQCLRYICQNVGRLFNSKEFLRIDQNLLCEIFERDQLMINDEFDLWKAALRWANEKCRQKAIDCSADNRRAALGPALFKIRFPLISPEEFTESIFPSGILTNDEFIAVYQFNSHPNLRDVPGLKPLKFPWHGRISDWNIAKGNRGTLAMEIEKFSEFSREKVASERNSEIEVFMKGLPWKISAQIKIDEKNTEKKWLSFFLWCTASKNDGNWSCKCSATLRIVSQSGTEDLTKKYDHVLSNKMNNWGFPYFITFAKLMDPSKGFYDKNEDKVTLAIDVTVGEEKGTKKRKLADE
ncbi:hypothetical protein niasHT_027730 [Heterodera trifolii]|uniref:BTB domain-containing protein n=1 Tax=Heterodera trifolii TaxID=157864 RepID=A0ABD2KIR9_9BILA